jgi:hypothetical protein
MLTTLPQPRGVPRGVAYPVLPIARRDGLFFFFNGLASDSILIPDEMVRFSIGRLLATT